MLIGHLCDTFSHSSQVAALTISLADTRGIGHREEVQRWAEAMFRDIGKARVPTGLLNKMGSRNQREWQLMLQHPNRGERLLEESCEGDAALEPVLEHHERWDVGGYPAGLRGDQISLSGRITKVADIFHALISWRTYKDFLGACGALSLMRHEMRYHFDHGVPVASIQMLGNIAEDPYSGARSVA